MCGIIGCISDVNIIPILINGLKSLEYRGYDSCGIAIKDRNRIEIKKDKGRINEIEKELNQLISKIGIAHTRWATHGSVNKENAHPHCSCGNEVAVVHNGIIENYKELKEILLKDGHKFKSETDTEVIAHLIEKFYLENKNFEKAFLDALLLLNGAYAIAAINKDEDRIYVAKKASPIVLAKTKNMVLVASDTNALLEYSKDFIFLNDNEIAILERGNISVLNLKNEKVQREIVTLKNEAEELSLGNFQHFMLKEIYQQPETIKKSISGIINRIDNLGFSDRGLDLERIKKINNIILVGCGTSFNAACIGKYYFEQIAKINARAEYASEFRYSNPVLDENTLVILLSQSGETADTIAALQEAKKHNAFTLGLVNVPNSTIARNVDAGFYLHSGAEISVASTKTFTSHVIILFLLSLYFGYWRKKIDKKQLNGYIKDIRDIDKKLSFVLNENDKIKKIAEKYFSIENALYLGRGLNFPVAMEGALKLKEISYIHAEGMPAAEIKHGPIALIDEKTISVFIATKDNLFDKIINNIQEIKTRNGKIIVISNDIIKEADENILVPIVNKYLSPIINVIPTQLLAYHIAVLRGCDVDKPRNLAKSVTVE